MKNALSSEPLCVTAAVAVGVQIAEALALDRGRISRELHDNIGSQLMLVLARLGDSTSPENAPLMLALELCLVDLRCAADQLDTKEDDLVMSLACLRYRVEQALHKQGTCLQWRVKPGRQLKDVTGPIALHMLRIAQECLSNVMRHAMATAVEVVLRTLPGSSHVVLEVNDNGRGFSTAGLTLGQDSALGKGLLNMKTRASAIGGVLTVSSAMGSGTRVKLTVPRRAEHARLMPAEGGTQPRRTARVSQLNMAAH